MVEELSKKSYNITTLLKCIVGCVLCNLTDDEILNKKFTKN